MDQSLKGDNNDELSSPSKKNGSSHCAPKSKLLKKYEPIPYELIEEEMEVFAQVQESMDQLWEKECQKYEETMQVVVDGKNLTVPRRNYFNEEEVVKDETLYPYDTVYYPLIDAYDCLYEEGQDQPISKNALRPNSEPFEVRLSYDEIENFHGYMPVSTKAMKESSFGLARDVMRVGKTLLAYCRDVAIVQHKQQRAPPNRNLCRSVVGRSGLQYLSSFCGILYLSCKGITD